MYFGILSSRLLFWYFMWAEDFFGLFFFLLGILITDMCSNYFDYIEGKYMVYTFGQISLSYMGV